MNNREGWFILTDPEPKASVLSRILDDPPITLFLALIKMGTIFLA